MVKKSSVKKEKAMRKHKYVKVTYHSGLVQDKQMKLAFLKQLLKDGYESLDKIKEVIDLATNTDIKSLFEHAPSKRHKHEFSKKVYSNEKYDVFECSICKRLAMNKHKEG